MTYTNAARAVLFLLMALAGVAGRAYALSPDSYASSSALAQGRWVKIEASTPGAQFISNAQLRNMGFADPAKVNVYGYGGRMVSELMNASQADDLPIQPLVRTDEGIYFVAIDPLTWKQNITDGICYRHEINPYSTGNYYFLSDAETGKEPEAERDLAPQSDAANDIATFLCRLWHEKEMAAPANTGRVLLGEDFRTQTSQTFSFNLTDNASDFAIVGIEFYAAASNANTSISVSANGTVLPSKGRDVINAITGEYFARSTYSVKEVSDPGSKLDLGITFNAAGTLKMARLNLINVEYERKLRLADGQLYFYNSTSAGGTYSLDGCQAATVVFDVTDPARPFKINYLLENGKARFRAPASGYREFVAFTPSSSLPSPKAVETIGNQDIHAMATPDMVIVSPSAYLNAAQRLADHRASTDGLRVAVLTPEQIYNEFSSGSPDVGGIRKCLKMWRDRGEDEEGHLLQYALLFGRPTYDNREITDAVKALKVARVPIWQSSDTQNQLSSFSTDLIMAMLEDAGSTFRIDNEKISIGIGRLPVMSASEAESAVAKIIAYDTSKDYGSWRNKIMLIADDSDANAHFNQAESVHGLMTNPSNGNGAAVRYERLYLDAYPLESSGSGLVYKEPHRLLLQAFDEGVTYIDYIGHANPAGWGHEGLLTWTDISSMVNKRWPFIYAATCEFARWDQDSPGGAEVMWAYPEAGAIGFIGTSRSVYITNNGQLNDAMHSSFFKSNEQGLPKRIGDIFRDGMNAMKGADSNKLRYLLMGDPAMRLRLPQYSITVDRIGDVDLIANPEGEPVVKARGQVKIAGRVLNPDGELAADFNGLLEPTLYDAEKVIETYGHGDGQNDAPTMYNDHKSILFTGNTQVKEGLWEATLLMPSEIENNWSPALLSLYAYSEAGCEANGASTSLYVYGYDENALPDENGPEIKSFYINNPSFEDGGMTAESLVVYAEVRDESGINLSQSGIGHSLRLTLDEKTGYSDLNQYYTPSPTDPCGGSLAYLLTDIEPGEHSLRLTVWDNANNCSYADLSFKVQAGRKPQLYDVTTDVSPAKTSVVFTITHDQPGTTLGSTVEVFDLGGRRIWSGETSGTTGMEASVQISWNLTDVAGSRVPRGIYLYRATIETLDGRQSTMTKKMAVAAP